MISYSVTNSCGTATTTHAITVNPLPSAGTITGITSVCLGGTTTLAISGGAGGGTWSSATPSVATINGSGMVTTVSTGTAVISYTVTNSCGDASATILITVNQLPDAGRIYGKDSLCAGSTITLVNAATGGSWSSSNTSIATVSTTGIVTGIAAGADTIRYIVTNACGSDTAIFPIWVRSLASCNEMVNRFKDLNGSSITIFPIPNSGIFTITLSTHLKEDVQIQIINLLGQKVNEFIISTNVVTEIRPPIPTGLYFINATTTNERWTTKLLIE